jgi:hypothetical protein
MRRAEAAAYLSLSTPQLDLLRALGHLHPVAIPSDRSPTGTIRVPLYDVRDLDALIDKWKVRDAP